MKANQTDFLLTTEMFSGSTEYVAARTHSEELDKVVGFEISAIENRLLVEAIRAQPDGNHKTWGQALHQGNQTWVGLSHQTLQTPYSELKQMCEQLKLLPGQTMVDLGAGYGRLGLLLGVCYPELNFLGYEIVGERVAEGKRIFEKYHCSNAKLIQQDLTDDEFEMPLSDYYLIYDYGTVAHIRKTLSQLEKVADHKKFKLIGRGKGTRSIIENEYPWLSQVHPVIHQEQYSIYSMSLD